MERLVVLFYFVQGCVGGDSFSVPLRRVGPPIVPREPPSKPFTNILLYPGSSLEGVRASSGFMDAGSLHDVGGELHADRGHSSVAPYGDSWSCG